MKKLTRGSFIKQVLNEGSINIDNDGKYIFVVTRINNENFKDVTPKLQQQLEDEGKYNSWIGFITYNEEGPYSTNMLPIFGDPNKYVTKWFTNTPEESIDQNLRDRQIGLLKRANEYLGY